MKRRCLSLLQSACSARRRTPDHVAPLAAVSTLVHSTACRWTVHTPHGSAFSTSATRPDDKSRSPPALPTGPSSPPTRLSEPPPAAVQTPPEPFYTLGLDINTHSIGYVLLSPSLHTLRHGLITLSHLPSTPSPAARLHHTTTRLHSVLSTLPPQASLHTAVESYLLGFSGRAYQTRHLFQLAAFNSLVQCQLWHLGGRRHWPAPVSVRAARARWGLRGAVTDAVGGRRVSDVKEAVWRWVDERLRREREAQGGAGAEGASVEWRRKRDGSVHATMFDISDAYLVALTAAMERNEQHNAATAEEAQEQATAAVQRAASDGEEGENAVQCGKGGRLVSNTKKAKLPRAREPAIVAITTSISSISSSESSVSDSSSGQVRRGRRRRIAASE